MSYYLQCLTIIIVLIINRFNQVEILYYSVLKDPPTYLFFEISIQLLPLFLCKYYHKLLILLLTV